MSRKSIVHINTNDLKGGAAKVAWRLAESQRRQGMHSNLLVGSKESRSEFSYPFFTDRDFSTHQETQDKGGLYYDLRGSHKLTSNSLVQSADILHLHNLHGDYFNPYSFPSLTQSKPVLWTLHDMQPLTGHCSYSFDCDRWQMGCGNCPDLNIYPSIKTDSTNSLWKDKQNIYSQSEMIVVSPSKWLQDIAQKGMLKNHRVELIYNGVDTNIFYPKKNDLLKRYYGIPEDKLVIGCVSNGGSFWDPRKGGYYIKQVLDHMRVKNDKFIFLNIGSSGMGQDDPFIIDVGYLMEDHDLAEVYSLFDVFLFPSVADNCPLVLSEALACGIPTVTFSTGGIPELITHGRNGFVADYKDTSSLIRYLDRLIGEPELRKVFSSNARHDAETIFDHKHTVSQYSKLYEEAIEHFNKRNTPINKKSRETYSRQPSVLIVYNPGDRENYLVSETYRSIVQQNYENKFLYVGRIEELDLSAFAVELIYHLKEGAILSPGFLNMMLHNYQGEELISCDLEIGEPISPSFTHLVSADMFFEADRYIVKMNKQMCIIFSKSFFMKNKEAILQEDFVEAIKISRLRAVGVSADKNLIKNISALKEKKIIVFGTGSYYTKFVEGLLAYLDLEVDYFVDNNQARWGQQFAGKPICPPDKLRTENPDELLIVVATSFFEEVKKQLKSMGYYEFKHFVKNII